MQQLSLFEEDLTEWTSDDWQTPNREAEAIARLTLSCEQVIIDAGAGRGQITKFLPNDRTIYAVERNRVRVANGEAIAPCAIWINQDYLEYYPPQKADLVIANPPFSQTLEFIAHSLQLLAPSGRVLFLLPIDWNCRVGASAEWERLNAHIRHEYRFRRRVNYLNNRGVIEGGRQVCDAVFDIRLGREGAAVSYLEGC